jgi:hypothetical protein
MADVAPFSGEFSHSLATRQPPALAEAAWDLGGDKQPNQPVQSFSSAPFSSFN